MGVLLILLYSSWDTQFQSESLYYNFSLNGQPKILKIT